MSFASGAVGTLQLIIRNLSTRLTGEISGLAAGDTIDFRPFGGYAPVTGVSVNGTTLAVSFSDGTGEDYTLASPLPDGDTIHVASDGQGGTEIVVVPPFTWAVDGTSGDWGTASNWSPSGVPDGVDTASISRTGTETVTVSSDEAAKALTLDDPNAKLSITSGAELSVNGLTATAVKAIEVADGTLHIGGGSATLDSFTLDLGGAGSGTLSADGTLTLGPSLTVTVSNGVINGGASATGIIDNQGLVHVTGSLSMTNVAGFDNTGVTSIDGGSLLLAGSGFDNENIISLSNQASLTLLANGANSGTISVGAGSHITIASSLGGSGKIEIDDGGTLEVDGSPSNEVSFASGAVGTLQLIIRNLSTRLTGEISGLAAGDTIDFRPFGGYAPVTGVSVNGTTLAVSFSDGTGEDYTLASPLPDGDTIHVASDGQGGTEIVVVPPFTWAVDGTSGDWGTASDWSPSGVPDGVDTASISRTGTETVTVSADEAVDDLTLDDPNAKLSITSGAELSVNGLTATAVQAIEVADGTLHIGGGSTTLNGFALDLGGAGPGTLTGDGTLTLGPSLIVNATNGAIESSTRPLPAPLTTRGRSM